MICKNCKYYDGENKTCRNIKARYVGCEECSNANPKPTNADRIRAMSDKELAEFLQKNRGGCRALTTKSYVCDFYTEDLDTDCDACWLDWLKREVDE